MDLKWNDVEMLVKFSVMLSCAFFVSVLLISIFHFIVHCRVFFEACDGFFTNYNWTEQSLENMKNLSVAQERQVDIFVGVDVFARSDVVGGKFETNKVRNVLMIKPVRTQLCECHRIVQC